MGAKLVNASAHQRLAITLLNAKMGGNVTKKVAICVIAIPNVQHKTVG
jgi:hypothetical protein